MLLRMACFLIRGIMMNTYRAGIDIGSTTIKLVVLDEEDRLIYGRYRRHCAEIQPTLCALLEEAREQLGACSLKCRITGSGSINLGKSLCNTLSHCAGTDYAYLHLLVPPFSLCLY